MISTAGSPEGLIQRLLKERMSARAQNRQLWRLLDKQKSMITGLHADLERALEDKARYKRIIDQLAQLPVTPDHVAQINRKPSPAMSTSSVPSMGSQDQLLPIQRHSGVNTDAGQPAEADRSLNPAASDSNNNSRPITPASARTNTAPSSSSTTSFPGRVEIVQREGGDGPARRTVMRTAAPAPIEASSGSLSPRGEEDVSPKTPRTPQVGDINAPATKASFTERRSQPDSRKTSLVPFSSLPGSPDEDASTSPNSRKLPPAPLNLRKTSETALATRKPVLRNKDSESDYDEPSETSTLPTFERGRKKTREEDDLEREVIMVRQQHSASLSQVDEKKRAKSGSNHKKTASSQSVPTPAEPMPKPLVFKAVTPPGSSRTHWGKHGQHPSLASMLSDQPPDQIVSTERVLSPALKSPGLPVSPRPIDRPPNAALPRQLGLPQSQTISTSQTTLTGLPLSPRPSRQPAPLPPSLGHDKAPMSAPLQRPVQKFSRPTMNAPGSAALQTELTTRPHFTHSDSDQSQSSAVVQDKEVGPIDRSLVSDSHPDLLLPPNALPSVQVKVISSRLRPNRQSTFGLRSSNEESVFTLGVYARSNMRQLWRVEKAAISLPQLEQALKQAGSIEVKIPDRSLFSGQSPAKIDARREALEQYFETLLDMSMNEKCAVTTCRYFSSHVIPAEASSDAAAMADLGSTAVSSNGLDRKMSKEGYLTKKGKNFGGWKTRYFVLDDAILRYYDSPQGNITGNIRLTNAKIGKQNGYQSSNSPNRNGEDEEKEYRHAFIIMELKRKSENTLRHVLCAESDEERDRWVAALMHYSSKISASEEQGKAVPVRSPSYGTKSATLLQKKNTGEKSLESSEAASLLDQRESLQSLSYDNTVAGQAPVRIGSGSRKMKTPPPLQSTFGQSQSSPSQSNKAISGPVNYTVISDAGSRGNKEAISAPVNGAPIQNASAWGNKDPISSPRNGSVIQDASSWGNRPVEKGSESPKLTERESRKRSFWGFKHHGSDAPLSSSLESTSTISRPNARPVFGIPLADAVEFCMVPGSPVCLPGVVYRCLEYLEAEGAYMEEGIFRISGSQMTINKLKERFDTDGDVNLVGEDTFHDINAVASLLKLYLRELPANILTSELHSQFTATQELPEARRIVALNGLVHKLPLPNWTLLQAFCKFLLQVHEYSEVSKMHIRNLCIIFAPTLNINNVVLRALLEQFHEIFDDEHDAPAGETTIEVTAPSPQTPRGFQSPGLKGLGTNPALSLSREKESSPHGLGLTYDELIQQTHFFESDDGNHGSTTPKELAGTIDPPRLRSRNENGFASGSGTLIAGPEYAAVQQRYASALKPMGLSATEIPSAKDARAKRRESSMILMGPPNAGSGAAAGGGAAQHKSSMPLMRSALGEP